MGRRRQSREIALQALYIVDTSRTDPKEAFAIVNRRGESDDQQVLAFAQTLLSGALECRPELDKHIEDTAENWALSRMAAVDRNVLRLAAYELLYRLDTPVNVIIDEAIEIARKYSTEESTRFINGILDKIKEQRPRPNGRPAQDPS